MPVTQQQAQMIASLASDCRPNGAPAWDAPGIMSTIGKFKNLTLADVILAVIRAADDREAKTPGVLTAANSLHWRERGTRPQNRETKREVLNPAERCGICAKSQQACEAAPRYADDTHTFEPDFKTKRGDEVAQIVQSLKAELTLTAERPPEKTLDDLTPEQRDPRIAEVRDAIAPNEEMSA